MVESNQKKKVLEVVARGNGCRWTGVKFGTYASIRLQFLIFTV